MGDELKAGEMGSPDSTGMPTEFGSSMASAIEAALNDILAQEGKPRFPIDDNSTETRDRRALFVAIAQGVIRHLKENEAAFVIHLEFDGLKVKAARIEITVA